MREILSHLLETFSCHNFIVFPRDALQRCQKFLGLAVKSFATKLPFALDTDIFLLPLPIPSPIHSLLVPVHLLLLLLMGREA